MNLNTYLPGEDNLHPPTYVPFHIQYQLRLNAKKNINQRLHTTPADAQSGHASVAALCGSLLLSAALRAANIIRTRRQDVQQYSHVSVNRWIRIRKIFVFLAQQSGRAALDQPVSICSAQQSGGSTTTAVNTRT